MLYSCQKKGKLTKRILCETLSKTSIECDEQVIDELKQWKPFGEKASYREKKFHSIKDCDTIYKKTNNEQLEGTHQHFYC